MGLRQLAATSELSDLKGVVTIGAPSDPSHISHLFEQDKAKIESEGEVEVDLAGRKFTIKQQFLEDIQSHKILERISQFKGALLVMHSPADETVSIDHARHIYSAAKHPKSFVSLPGADHLLLNKKDSKYAANIIAAWAGHLFEDSLSA